jgi:protein TonB
VTRAERRLLWAALAVSLAVHAGALALWRPVPEAVPQAGGGAAIALLGTGVEDLVVGRLQPNATERVLDPRAPAEPAATVERVAPVAPAPAAPEVVADVETAEPAAAPVNAAPQAEALAVAEPVAGAAQPQAEAPAAQAETVAAAEPAFAAEPTAVQAPAQPQTEALAAEATDADPAADLVPIPAAPAPRATTETVLSDLIGGQLTGALAPATDPAGTALPEAPLAGLMTGRMLNPEVLRPGAGTPRPLTRPAPPPATARGNADIAVARGDSGGRSDGQAARQGTGAAPEAPAGAAAQSPAAARYPQRVNRHLGRLPRPQSDFGGTALVAFTIAPAGGLTSLRIARSSGDRHFDRLALGFIQSGVPYPAPPEGAQRSFQVPVSGR